MAGSFFLRRCMAQHQQLETMQHLPLTSNLYHSIICKICYYKDNMGNYAGCNREY